MAVPSAFLAKGLWFLLFPAATVAVGGEEEDSVNVGNDGTAEEKMDSPGAAAASPSSGIFTFPADLA